MKSTTLLVAIGAALLLLQAAAVVAEVGSDSDNTNNGNQNQITHVALDDSSFWSTLSRDSTRGWLVAFYGRSAAQWDKVKATMDQIGTTFTEVKSSNGDEWVHTAHINVTANPEVSKRLGVSGGSPQIWLIRNGTMCQSTQGLDAAKVASWATSADSISKCSVKKALPAEPSPLWEALEPTWREIEQSWTARPKAMWVVVGYGIGIGMLIGLLLYLPCMPPALPARAAVAPADSKKKNN